MATKSKGGVLLPVVLLVGAMVYFGGKGVVNWGEGVIDDVFGEDYAVASEAKPLVKQCTTEQVLKDRRCGDVKIVVLDAEKMPYITRNIQLAWGEGKPFVLHRNLAAQCSNRATACPRSFPKRFPKGSCDEYPFASTSEGGAGSRTEEVHQDEQNCQGGTLSRAYQNQQINDGDGFLVVISNPGKITSSAWQGQGAEAGQC